MSDALRKDIDSIVKPGDVLAGKYLVDRVLGVGGMGVVVAATHTQLDQRVAIKFLLPSMLPNREVVERFSREARAAAKIRSEHVVRVSDVGELPQGLPYIVMEFLEGRDLGELLQRRGVLPIPLAIDYVLEACEALAEAHAAGIVHRDLKPANLFLTRQADETEIVKVLDFGISKQILPDGPLHSNPSLTKTTDVFGSPTYMSPEQLKASKDVDARSDVWSLGVILFELLAGKPPFGGNTVAEIFGAILHQPAPRLRDQRKDAPPELESVILRCLDKDPSTRVQNVADLAEALLPFGSDAARDSAARVSRVLRGPHSRLNPRPSQSGARASLPSYDPSEAPAVEASTGVDAAKREATGGDSGSPGGATSTSWGHIKPAGVGPPVSRKVLIVAAVAIAAAGGAFVTLRALSSSASGVAAQVPSGEARPATTSIPSTTVVLPAPTETSTAATPAVTPVPTASVGSKPTPRIPSAAPTASAAPSTKPSATTTPSATPPPTGKPPSGDDDFGGRR